MKTQLWRSALLTITVCTVIASCSTAGPLPAWKSAVEGDGPGDPTLLNRDQLVVKNLPKSRIGNQPQYTVFDQTYKVMDSAKGFTEWGAATWYGEKFHGRATASGEIYDMHMLSAAHRNLPLPTFVRVTRIDTDRSVVVKVNDRGPFVDDRIIDLSYAAAAKLGMLKDGVADVYIEALSDHEGASEVMVETANDEVTRVTPTAAVVAVPEKPDVVGTVPYVQAGAFSERANAEKMMSMLKTETDLPVVVDYESASALFRVRVGPLSKGQNVQEALDVLAESGIKGYTVMAPAR